MTECHVPSVVSDDADENETSTGRPEAKFRFPLEGRICQTDRPRPVTAIRSRSSTRQLPETRRRRVRRLADGRPPYRSRSRLRANPFQHSVT